ncbi:MAG: sigma-70 family RNA polymerase sigma factor [Acidobacteria bacterium]|nr:sigma-70 family RNA polymerase sigma factor [Acidobacteriota bacterium]
MESSPQEVTRLLMAWRSGVEAALDQLMPLVYDELRRLASHYMQNERPGHTLQTTALVHEAYLRLVDYRQVRWQDRAHFFAVAARLMRRILVDHARVRQAARRGGSTRALSLDEAPVLSDERAAELISLDDALTSLEAFDARLSRVIEMRFFGGLTADEIGMVLNLSARTVMRDWNVAQAWLYREMTK